MTQILFGFAIGVVVAALVGTGIFIWVFKDSFR